MNFTRVFVTVSPRRPWDRGCGAESQETSIFIAQSHVFEIDNQQLHCTVPYLLNVQLTHVHRQFIEENLGISLHV